MIGGGDWSSDRLVPDIIRALTNHQSIITRYPDAIRPWQHVLDSIEGYLKLIQYLFQNETNTFECFNFGPSTEKEYCVQDFINKVIEFYPHLELSQLVEMKNLHEENYIGLDTTQARNKLAWLNKWSFDETVKNTMDWYLKFLNGEDPWEITI